MNILNNYKYKKIKNNKGMESYVNEMLEIISNNKINLNKNFNDF